MFFYFYFIIFVNNCFTSAEIYLNSLKHAEELLLCRKCGADVADSFYIFTKQSPGAKKIEKQNLFGKQNVTVQTLINPFGVNFELITIEKARCKNMGSSQGADSWFPGYAWRICTCPHCAQHLGWTFENSSNKNLKYEHLSTDVFHGLILNNILGENFTDSLLMMPKFYKI